MLEIIAITLQTKIKKTAGQKCVSEKVVILSQVIYDTTSYI